MIKTAIIERETVSFYKRITFNNFFFRIFSNLIWANTPRWSQFTISRIIRFFCELRLSRFIIPIYCRLEYPATYDLNRFVPASGMKKYISFQDFFMRKLKELPGDDCESTWPCDGLLCDLNRMSDNFTVKVKGEPFHVRDVFGNNGHTIPRNYHFANIFLHNKDYHRIHTPVSGTITRIEHIPGKLFILRPWAYNESPTLPALTNERINIDIKDKKGQTWYLSIVGGPGVSTIHLDTSARTGSYVSMGEELAAFAIGSTCCIAAPVTIKGSIGNKTSVGEVFF